MIHELRVYQAVPGQMAKLQARFRDQLPPIWETHGIHAIGFWTTLVGGIQQSADLHPPVGVAGRSRDEVDGVPERPGLAQGARRGRTRWTDCRKHQQSNPDANCLLGIEIDRRSRKPVG
jgi:hypothetical protein